VISAPPSQASSALRVSEHPRNVGLRRYATFWVLAVLVCSSDQITKEWVYRKLPFGTFLEPDRIEVIPGFFNIVHVGNTGAAWGIFEGGSLWLALLAIATLGAIHWFRRHLGLHLRPVQIAFGLLTGGIVGNMVDRFLHGHVVDFLDFRIFGYIYPTFNIADCGIVVGVIFYMILSFRHPELRVK
jgi:signal peptidase II